MGKNKAAVKPKRQRKTDIVFDEDSRREFLTGFRKRKEERRRIGREKAELALKEEKRIAKSVV